jgi:phosphoribosylglycinamide formyltransferase-1
LAADRAQPVPPLRAAVFASGTGTNADNIIRTCKTLDGLEIALIVTNNPDAGVIARAASHGIPCAVIPRPQNLPPREAKAAQERGILAALQDAKIDWLFLAGFMQLLSPDFLRHFYDAARGYNRAVNIHPSLLPDFAGKDSYHRAFDAGGKTHGVTLHYVDDGMDTGAVIAQAAYTRTEDMDFDAFCAAGQKLEYSLYSTFIRALAQHHTETVEKRKWAQI